MRLDDYQYCPLLQTSVAAASIPYAIYMNLINPASNFFTPIAPPDIEDSTSDPPPDTQNHPPSTDPQ